MNKTKKLNYITLVAMKKYMITITGCMLLVRSVLVNDVQNIIRETEKNY